MLQAGLPGDAGQCHLGRAAPAPAWAPILLCGGLGGACQEPLASACAAPARHVHPHLSGAHMGSPGVLYAHLCLIIWAHAVSGVE